MFKKSVCHIAIQIALSATRVSVLRVFVALPQFRCGPSPIPLHTIICWHIVAAYCIVVGYSSCFLLPPLPLPPPPLRFSAHDGVSGSSLAKSSVSRNIKKSILESYPLLEPNEEVSHLDGILGDKKQPLYVIKCHDRVNMVAINKEPKFFSLHDEQWLPTLRLLHQFPDLLPTVQVDRGAIKFVMKGADIMAPGLTSAGGDLSNDLPAETYVAIKAEGMEQILAIGKLVMSTADIKKINKNTAITNLHYLNDGLWNTQHIE